jgi:hypothetical protein
MPSSMQAVVIDENIKIPTKTNREATQFWLKVATDLNAGFTPDEIAERYTNPKTGKKYTREHIYWVIRQLKTRQIN